METALCRIYSDLIVANSKVNCTLPMQLDLIAAFDTVDVEIQLADLSVLSIGGTVHQGSLPTSKEEVSRGS